MKAVRALQLYKQLNKIREEMWKNLPKHPESSAEDTLTKDWNNHLGKSISKLDTSINSLMEHCKELAIQEL